MLRRARTDVGLVFLSVIAVGVLLNYREIRAAADLRLLPPVSVTHAGYYRDGGSGSVTFRDVLGRSYAICCDGRILSPTAGRWYVGTHPTHSGARLLPADAREPGSSLVLARVWLRRSFSEDERALMHSSRFEPATRDEQTAWTLVWQLHIDRDTARTAN